jgi:hypothetical protein
MTVITWVILALYAGVTILAVLLSALAYLLRGDDR